jgi:hypothetical protein
MEINIMNFTHNNIYDYLFYKYEVESYERKDSLSTEGIDLPSSLRLNNNKNVNSLICE